jgi:geranylgeranyl pyrophosphate synthase
MDRSPEEGAAQKPQLAVALAQSTRRVEEALDALLPRPHGLHGRIHEAMRYAIFAGGKRLRPFLVLQSAELYGKGRPARGRRNRSDPHLLARSRRPALHGRR